MIKPVLAAVIAFAALVGAQAKADEYGLATYYRNPWHGGLIAAHRTLPFGSHVRVTNLDNGRSAIVTIVDLSTYAADALGMRQAGVAHVKLENH